MLTHPMPRTPRSFAADCKNAEYIRLELPRMWNCNQGLSNKALTTISTNNIYNLYTVI